MQGTVSSGQMYAFELKVEQPVKALPAWLVLATVLSYWGYFDAVVDLFQQASKKSRAYVRSHHFASLQS